jgi:glycosyltransferase involved in cell wall biosynthesis
LLKNPPQGYNFVVSCEKNKKFLMDIFKKLKFPVWIYKNLIKKYFNVLKIVNNMHYNPSKEKIDIILSTGTMVDENKPWIIKILDSPFSMAGHDYKLFLKNLNYIRRYLESDNCKSIIVHTNAAKKGFEKYFSKKIVKKIVLVNPAIPGDIVPKKKKFGKIRLLFMGSINNPQEFFLKGGLETLETFKLVNEKYKNIELVMRCKIPSDIKDKYKLKNLIFLENFLSDEEMKKLYLSSDVLLLPGYNYFIMAYLEAFKYGIPIVALDTYGVKDFIKNGKNGFYVKPSKNLPINTPEYPANNRSKKFIEGIKKIDGKVIANLAKEVSILIENKKLREKMSKECQRLFLTKHSYRNKKKILKRIFDKAIK